MNETEGAITVVPLNQPNSFFLITLSAFALSVKSNNCPECPLKEDGRCSGLGGRIESASRIGLSINYPDTTASLSIVGKESVRQVLQKAACHYLINKN